MYHPHQYSLSIYQLKKNFYHRPFYTLPITPYIDHLISFMEKHTWVAKRQIDKFSASGQISYKQMLTRLKEELKLLRFNNESDRNEAEIEKVCQNK